MARRAPRTAYEKHLASYGVNYTNPKERRKYANQYNAIHGANAATGGKKGVVIPNSYKPQTAKPYVPGTTNQPSSPQRSVVQQQAQTAAELAGIKNRRAAEAVVNSYNNAVRSFNASIPSFEDIAGPYLGGIQSGGWSIQDDLPTLNAASARAGQNYANLSGIATYDPGLVYPELNTMATFTSANGKGTFERDAFDYLNTTNVPFAPIPDYAKDIAPYLSNVQSNMTALEQLIPQRQAAEDDFYNFQSDVRGRTGSLLSNSYGATIADPDLIDRLGGEATQLRGQLDAWRSPINDPAFNTFDYSSDNIDNALARIDKLSSDRAAELSRISDFDAQSGADLTNYENTLAGLTIANLPEIQQLQSNLRNAQGSIGGFNSVLTDEFDFQPYLNSLSDMNSRVSQLLTDRATEEGRISGEDRRLKALVDSMRRTTSSMTPQNLSNIDDARAQLEGAIGDITGFESLLPYDFAGYQDSFNTYLDSIADVEQQRQTDLDEYLGFLNQSQSDFDELELYDESGMTALDRELQRQYGRLSQYSGGRAPGLQEQFEDLGTGITNRLGELYDYRDDLESQASDRLTRLRRGFTDLDSLEEWYTDLDSFRDTVSQYGADQVRDELASIDDLYRTEESRLSAELAARRSREEEEALRAQNRSAIFNNPRSLTPNEYAALLAGSNPGTTSQDYLYSSPTVFSAMINQGVV